MFDPDSVHSDVDMKEKTQRNKVKIVALQQQVRTVGKETFKKNFVFEHLIAALMVSVLTRSMRVRVHVCSNRNDVFF